MKRRRWKSETKTLIVLKELKGRPIGELCNAHRICQSQYYQLRDQVMTNASRALETTPLISAAPAYNRRIQAQDLDLGSYLGTKKNEEGWG